MTEERSKIQDDEIDLMALLQTIWNGRKTILKFLIVFSVLGLFIALFSPKEYTASTIMVPVSSEKTKVGSNLGGLAAMAGIDLKSGDFQGVPPTLYPKVIQSIPFKKELIETPLNISDVKGKISYREYFQDIYNPGVLVWLKKYTIGLPGVIIKSIRGNKESKPDKGADLLFISAKEKELYDRLEDQMQLEVNDKDGYVKLSTSMPEAIAAAQLAQKAQLLLQDRIIDFKSKKAVEQLHFVEERYKEKQEEFRKAEYALANFRDRNKNVISARAATQESRLKADYNLVYGVYSELAKQVEQQKIQVKEDTPVFTIIEPVSVPVVTSKPKRAIILYIWIFIGLVAGIGMVFGKGFVKNMKEKI